jgi:ligand-binding sensor domain-containing protein
MRKSCPFPVLFLSILLLLGQPSEAERYKPGDWVSYTNFRFVTSIAQGDRYVYFGTTGGVMRYDYWRDLWETPLTTSSGLLDNYVLDAAVDEIYHEVFFKTRSGICHYDPVLESWISGGRFPSNFSDPDFQYPDLSPDFGLNFYREEWGAHLTDSYLRRYPLTAHLSDKWGNLWVGTAGLGAGRATLRTGRLKMLQFGLMERNVAAIILDDQHIWMGGVNMWDGPTGITRVHRNLQTWDYFEARYLDGLRSDDATSFAANGHKVWMGTLYGLSIYDKKMESWQTLTSFDGLADDWVTDVVLDGGIVWVGTSFGASSVDARGDSVVAAEVPLIGRQRIYDIETDDEFVWFGADHGVYALDKVQNRWIKFTSPNGTINGTVTAISSFEDEIWFGTPLGLTLYQRSRETWRWFSSHHQLAVGNIICLKAGPKAVWAGTDSGLWKFTRRTGLWRSFTAQDGLLENVVQAIFLDGAYIWLGTAQGVTRFYWDNPMRID